MLNKKEINVAVLPGGGMAGAYTIQVIKIIDDMLLSNGLPGFSSQFDIYFCTSTGSIIGGGIIGGMRIDDIYSLYMEGDKYFQYAAPWYIPNNIHIPRYKWEPIIGCLKKHFLDPSLRMGDIFDATGKELMLCTVNKNYYSPLNEFIKSWNSKYKEELLLDAIHKSFSASIYFGNTPDDKYRIVYGDGGEGDMNNPILEAYASICRKWPNSSVKMLNIGTGYFNYDMGYEKAKSMWRIKRALKVPMMARSQSMKTSVYAAESLSNRDPKFKFYHIDAPYPDENMNVLDGVKYIPQYKNLAISSMTDSVKKDVINFLK